MTERSKRLKILSISPDMFLSLFTHGEHHGYDVVRNVVPKDARLMNVRGSIAHGWPHMIELLIASDEFPELQDGEAIPQLCPVMEFRKPEAP